MHGQKPTAVMLGAWCLAVWVHPWVAREPPLTSPPAAPVLAFLTGGHAGTAATASWSATVVHQASGEPKPDELYRGIAMARFFDPSFQQPAIYGSIFLQRSGAHTEAQTVLEHAATQWPQEPWFPWALGMNAWMAGETEKAAIWLDRAGELEPSGIHGRAAEALRER